MPAHDALRTAVRDFARSEITPRIPHMEASGEIEHVLVKSMAAQGWFGVTIPAEHGGLGAGHEAKSVVIEEIARVSAAMGAAFQAAVLGQAMALHLGTPEQQRRWLPGFADGSCLPSIAVTEEHSGGHVLGMESTGRRRNRGGWVLNGRKVFVGNSLISQVHCVVVRTGKTLTAFLVEDDRKGVRSTPHEPRLGLRGFSYGELVLDDVRVPDENRLGEVGDGLTAAYSSSVLYGRLNLAAVAVGIHTATLEQTTAHLDGRPRVAGQGVVRARLARIDAGLRASRHLVHHAARRLDLGEPCDTDLLTAKYQAVEGVLEGTALAMRNHGAAGLLADLPMERFFRDAQCVEPPAGTGDVQLHRLAEELLTPGRHVQWSERFARPLTPPTPRPWALAPSA
ncbi:acyl-CoA dehydrogenase family protein [Streptomyces sp. NPDC000594]|uniref:acyl-CoA dehydrogenase family protein n=1 Tax=Streptomyces sp. NPDC000594 TaxID=3154261 RepID=UPI003330172A